MTYTPRNEQISGSDLTGSDGETGRTYTLANDDAISEQLRILKSEAVLQVGINYTFDEGSGVITFLSNVWDSESLSLDYLTDDSSSSTVYEAKQYSIVGSDLSGSDGESDRVFQFILNHTLNNSMTITKNEASMQQGVNFTVNTTNKTITFTTAVFDLDEIVIDFYIEKTTYYADTLQITRFSGIGVEVQLEDLGTGDSSNRSFDVEHGNIIEGSYTLYYGSSTAAQSNRLSIMTEGTDYLIGLDDGRIYLLAAGVTKLSTDKPYLSYVYSPKHSDTVLKSFLPGAEDEVERMTDNYWGVVKTSIQYFDGYDSGYPQTDRPFGYDQPENPEFELQYEGISTITSVVYLDATGDTTYTVDSDYIDFSEEGRLILKNQSIPNGKRNVKVTFTHGYSEVPILIQELTALIAGVQALVNISGGSYKDVSTYSLGRKSFSIGQVYVNIRESIDQMKSRIDKILDDMGPRYECA